MPVPRSLLCQTKVAKNLNALVIRVHHEDSIIAIDEQTRRQSKISEPCALLTEVIQEDAFSIKYLHHVVQTIDHVNVAFRIHSHSLWPEEIAPAVPHVSDGALERPGTVQHLDAEVHRIHHNQVRAVEAQLRRIVKFAVTSPILPKGLQNAALHVHHENLVA